jgi:hypothetical protein
MSPKTLFQKSAQAKVHADIVAQAVVTTAFDVALLQLLYELGNSADPTSAGGSYLQLVGAQKLRTIFMSLSEQEKPSPRLRSDNLNP